MREEKLTTNPYKGVRDFYPEDMAVQQYIFKTWATTAERFGFERYDASILEPADMYRAKGAENAEMVNEQTYTFTDRGDREVTLRPEMTPTVARMVAGRQRELAFPLRWYSIPNLFRYERMQKGRLREHWQLNCDIFGATDVIADIEIIALAYQTMIDFGATPNQFQIQINDRKLMDHLYQELGIDEMTAAKITRLNDRRAKIDASTYRDTLDEITNDSTLSQKVIEMLDNSEEETGIVSELAELGITNVVFNKSLARGFDYYTGTIFEVFEVDEDGSSTGRSMIGGGRYDNLTGMFGTEPISGVGFGMGDVTMRDFLERNELLSSSVLSRAADVAIIPDQPEQNLIAEIVAQKIRQTGTSVLVDIATRKTDKKVAAAQKRGNKTIIVVDDTNASTSELRSQLVEKIQADLDK